MDMAAEVRLNDIIDALESASDESSWYVDVVTGEMSVVTEEEFSLAEDETPPEDIPKWQREAGEIAKKLGEEKRILVPAFACQVRHSSVGHYGRFALPIEDEDVSANLRNAIRGAGAFCMFKRLLSEYLLWDNWKRFRQREFRRMAVGWCNQNGIRYATVRNSFSS